MNISDAKVGDPAVICPAILYGRQSTLNKIVTIEAVGKRHVIAGGRRWTMRGEEWGTGSDTWCRGPRLRVGADAVARAEAQNDTICLENEAEKIADEMGDIEWRQIPLEQLRQIKAAVGSIIADAKAKEQP